MLTRYKGKTALKSRGRSNRAVDGVGVKFDAAVVQEAGQTMRARQRVPDRFGERAGSEQQQKLRFEPSVQSVDDWLGAVRRAPSRWARD